MKTRLNVLLAIAGIATVLLTGCVSSKKYKSSEAALQQVRNDSSRLAQQVASLNENVQTLEQKNTTLQRSLDSTSNNYASQQKSLDYYQNYFDKQQSSMSQVSDELKGALSQAGLANEDVQQANGAIYVSLDESKIFKKNSTVVTPNGRQALNSLAQVIKNRSDVNVVISNGDSSMGSGSTAGNMPSSSDKENATVRTYPADNVRSGNAPANPTPRHRKAAKNAAAAATRSNATGNDEVRKDAAKSADANVAANAKPQNSNKGNVAVARKKVHRKHVSSEESMTFYDNKPNLPRSKSWALKQSRVNTVANGLLQNGVPKLNVLMQQPASGSEPNNSIKVIITPTMSDFNPQKNSSAKTETK